MQVESIKGTIRSVTADLVSNVVLYDEDFFPDDRKAFIRNWILEEETVAVVLVDNEYSSKVLGNNHRNITCRILFKIKYTLNIISVANIHLFTTCMYRRIRLR